MSGVRVVEAGWFASAPSCATILADWGAEVIKLEPPGGDPGRKSVPRSGPYDPPIDNPRFDVHNRSRRSVTLNLLRPDAQEVAHRLIDTADVFLTNLPPSTVRRLRLDSATLRARHPRLVYAHLTGYGDAEIGRNRYQDLGAFWAYSGLASLFRDADGRPPRPVTGMGDRTGGLALAGAISAALFRRERTGAGAEVNVSLLRTAMWLIATDVADALHREQAPYPGNQETAPIPTINCYRCGDGRWLWLQVLFPERNWPVLLEALDGQWLADDPRFGGGDPAALRRHAGALTETFDEIFRQRTYAEWAIRLDAAGLAYSPVQELAQSVLDPIAHTAGAFRDLPTDGGSYRTVNTPADFVGSPLPVGYSAPAAGNDTVAVLSELGLTLAEIAALSAQDQHGQDQHGDPVSALE